MPAFAMVLIGPMLWTRFEGHAGGVTMIPHAAGPAPSDGPSYPRKRADPATLSHPPLRERADKMVDISGVADADLPELVALAQRAMS